MKGQCRFYSSVCWRDFLISLPSGPWCPLLTDAGVVISEDALLISKAEI